MRRLGLPLIFMLIDTGTAFMAKGIHHSRASFTEKN